MNWQQAAENGDINALRDINNLIDKGTRARPLHYAAKGGQYQAVQFLIEKQVPIDAPDKFGRTPLYLAVFHRHLDVTKLLLQKEANPNIICQCGTSIVSKAAENGDIEILDLLLKRGVSWKTQNQDGETPKDLAKRNGHHLAWTRFEYCEADRLSDFLDAAKKGSVSHMRDLILSGGVDPNVRGITNSSALDLAVRNGQTEAVRFLLYDYEITQVPTAQRAQAVDSRGRTALHWGARKGDVSIVQLLLDAGASPHAHDKDHKTPLDRAAGKGREQTLELLRKWEEK